MNASESRFKAIFEQAPLGVAVIDSLNGRIQVANQMFATIARRSPGELAAIDGMSITHPDDVQTDLDQMKLMNEGSIPGFTMEKRYLTPDGGVVWISMKVVPLEVEDPARPHHLCMIEDIGERKLAETAMMNAQKLESLGVLAGGIAHDFNNILTAILGNLSLLEPALKADEGALGLLREAQEACGDARGLSNQLLTFAKGGSPVVKVMDLRPVITGAAEFAARGSNARCAFDLGEAPLAANIDKDQISRVIQNLVLNAIQAMPHGGEIAMRASVVELGASASPMRDAGRYVRLTVTDQGPGIGPGHLPKIFDPYFSTKGVGRGLGLATCYSIMMKHGGGISAEARPGCGAVFVLHLPLAPAAPSSGEEGRAAAESGRGRILIMDDEPAVARTLRRMLEHLGYEVETAGDGRSAIDAYSLALKEGRRFDAVILDLTIRGGMGGMEALAEISARDPEAKAIVSSGYATDPIMGDYASCGFSGILTKPYRLQDVTELIRRVIGGPGA